MLNVAAIQIIIWGFLCCLPVGPFIFCKSKLCVISASLLLLFRVSCWLAISDRSISYNHEACCKKAVQGLMLHKNTLLKIHFTGFSEFPYFWILRLPKSCCIVAKSVFYVLAACTSLILCKWKMSIPCSIPATFYRILHTHFKLITGSSSNSAPYFPHRHSHFVIGAVIMIMVMTVISNDEIRLMLYCSSFSLPPGLMIHLQIWIYFLRWPL